MTTSTAERQHGSVATGLVEYQMRFRELMERAAGRGEEAVVAPKTFGPYLTVSRECGSRGAEVAQKVGERLGWAVLDKELVNVLADQLKLEPRVLQLMDETRADWFSETLLNLFNSRLVLQHSYVALVGKAVALAAGAGRVVIVGRGANLILPPEGGLRVRVIAPRDFRIGAFADAEGIDRRLATKQVDEIDTNRREFVRRHFRCDPADSSLYDLVVNTGSFGIDGSAALILRALETRGLPIS